MVITTDRHQDQEFVTRFLDAVTVDFDATVVLEWVAETFQPHDVFEVGELLAWCRKYSRPEDVFEREDLANWAWDNDFVERE